MNKTQLKNKCKEILYKYPLNTNINKEDFNFLITLLQNHKNKELKIGKGILAIYIDKNIWNNRCFNILRIDNTTTDFSFLECISTTNKEKEINIACRWAIQNDIIKFKNNSKLIAHHDNISFNEIFKNWIKDKDINSIELLGHEDNSHTMYFKHKQLEQDFINFHNKYADLKLMDKQIHLHLKKHGK